MLLATFLSGPDSTETDNVNWTVQFLPAPPELNVWLCIIARQERVMAA